MITIKTSIVGGKGAAVFATGGQIFNDTWGHMAPVKDKPYKGHIIVLQATHGEYGYGTLVLDYDFPDINGPYIHYDVVRRLCDNVLISDEDRNIYKIPVTFRNYRYFFGQPKQIASI